MLPRSTKIIFLDMDGVVNSAECCYPILTEPDLHQPYLVNILKGLEEIPNLKIVLSSTWRLEYDTPEKVNELFRLLGLNFDCIGVTPRNGYCRGVEIDQWIKAHFDEYWLYKNYVIIDDDSDMLYKQSNNFFQTDGSVGITTDIVYRIKNFFNKE